MFVGCALDALSLYLLGDSGAEALQASVGHADLLAVQELASRFS